MPANAIANKTVPHNPQAEEAVLGSVMIDPECVLRLARILRPEDFYLTRHAWIYETFLHLYQNQQPIDMLMVTTRLEQQGRLESVGGAASISRLMNVVPSAINAESYAAEVTDTARRRELLDTAARIARAAYDEEQPVSEAIQLSQAAVFSVRNNTYENHLLHVREAGDLTYDRLSDLDARGLDYGIATGFPQLDEFFMWKPGELTVIAARPGVGKSAILSNFITSLVQRGHESLVFSAEMDYTTWVMRMLRAAGVRHLPGDARRSPSRIINWEQILSNLSQFAEFPLWIDDTPNISIEQLYATALEMASRVPLKFIGVDYLQLMNIAGRFDRHDLAVGQIVAKLKQLARELKLHVCVLSQLKRDAVGRKPVLSDLAESGKIENHANNVFLLSRSDETETDAGGDYSEYVTAVLDLAKQRNGAKGKVELVWDGPNVSYLPRALAIQEAMLPPATPSQHFADEL